jgi:hypothetical protein
MGTTKARRREEEGGQRQGSGDWVHLPSDGLQLWWNDKRSIVFSLCVFVVQLLKESELSEPQLSAVRAGNARRLLGLSANG